MGRAGSACAARAQPDGPARPDGWRPRARATDVTATVLRRLDPGYHRARVQPRAGGDALRRRPATARRPAHAEPAEAPGPDRHADDSDRPHRLGPPHADATTGGAQPR